MKKFIRLIISIKSFAALIFTGQICAYYAVGWLYDIFSPGAAFDYSLPLLFAAEGMALALIISALWELFLNDTILKNTRRARRLGLFAVSLAAIFPVFLLIFFTMPVPGADLWLIITGVFLLAIIMMAVLGELHFKATGRRYTVGLREYQRKLRGCHDETVSASGALRQQ